MKRKLTVWVLCLTLCAVTVLFASCRKTGNGESSDNGMDLSSDMSKVESDVSGAMSDVTSGLSSLFDPDESSSLSSASSDEAAPTGAAVDISDFDLSGLDKLENEKKGWGQGVQVDSRNRPISCDSYQTKYGQYGAVFIMPDTSKTMYLTFDEGYENGFNCPRMYCNHSNTGCLHSYKFCSVYAAV